MAKFCGMVGYGLQQELPVDETHGPSIVDLVVTERKYYGDVLQNNRRWEKGEGLNDDLNVSNKISIVADPYAYDHFFAIQYVCWMGSKWKVTSVDVERPRLILSLGGVWNGPESGT